MTLPARRQATWDDLLSVPDDKLGEIVNGELVMHPRPAAPHLETASDLGGLLTEAFRFGRGGPGGWVIIDEPRIAFGADVRVPEIGAWRRDRYQRPVSGPYAVVPDFVCEVLSPGTAVEDRTEKLPLYATHGVQFVWRVDPLGCALEAYRLESANYLLVVVARGRGLLRVPPFDAIELELELLWGDRWPPQGGETEE